MFRNRLRVLTSLLLFAGLVVLGRLAQLQLVRGEIYRQKLGDHGKAPATLRAAPRGPILDRDGAVLASDEPSFDLAVRLDRLALSAVDPADLKAARKIVKDTRERAALVERIAVRLPDDPWVREIARLSGRSLEETCAGLSDAFEIVARGWAWPSTEVTFLRGLDQRAWLGFSAAQEDLFRAQEGKPPWPGLCCTVSTRRVYPNGRMLAHVLGTLGEVTPEQVANMRAHGALLDYFDDRAEVWAQQRVALTDAQGAALNRVLGDDPRGIEDVQLLIERLRGLDRMSRAKAADLGLADAVRWSEQLPRIELNEAERVWLGCGLESPDSRARHATLADRRLGESGIERWYNEWLRGKPALRFGVHLSEEEAARTAHSGAALDGEPREGQSLRLTISSAWQRACETALAERTGPEGGAPSPAAMVVLDCNTGEVLALANFPDFDPNLFVPPRDGAAQKRELRATLADARKPLLNRCVSDQYPLGSVMKVLIAAVALEEHKVAPGETFQCPGWHDEGGRRYHCDNRLAHGSVSIVEALRRSCNVYFYQVGARIGVEALGPWAKAVGLGRRTGLDLPAEVRGIYPDRAWREKTFPNSRWDQAWSRGKDFHLAIGQGYMAVTPMQAACLLATIANGGYVVRPRLWLDAPPEARVKAGFSPGTLAIVRKGLEEVVSVGTPGGRGTAYEAFHKTVEPLAVTVAGKTGTADVAGDREPHAWFAGYAPADNPQVAFAIIVENGGHGGAVAGPIAYRVLKEIYGTRSAPNPHPGQPAPAAVANAPEAAHGLVQVARGE